jgi:biopolymer transport protein ExbD
MNRRRSCPEETPEIKLNMTPMIDIVFLLLVFFLYVTEMEEMDRRTGLQLPVADQADLEAPEERPLVLNLEYTKAHGRPVYYIDGRRADIGQLEKKLHLLAKETEGSATVCLRADERIDFQYIQEIMLICAGEKLYKLSFKCINKLPRVSRR